MVVLRRERHDGTRLYPKYQPVVPALFAVGLVVGVPRLVLAAAGAGVVGLVGLLTREAYDAQTALVASILVVASPLYLLSTSVSLPYAPTTLLNLGFARPYTAVLFALPFIGHALWLLWTARDDRIRRLALCVALVATPAVTVAEANALGPPVRENAAHTDRYANAYEPFADDVPEGVVFVPTPYGEWLGHPFQSLRNDPDLDGDTVFAPDRTPSENFAVLDAYPERDHYRFTHRGTWTAEPRDRTVADLQPIGVRSGEEHRVRFETGVVGRPSTVRIADGDDDATYAVTADPNETFAVEWTLTPGRAAVTADGLRQRDDGTVTFDGSAEISLAVTYVQAGGATVTYRQEVSVEERGDRVRLVWPPVVSVCRLTTDCGHEERYVSDGAFLDGVSVNQNSRSAPQDP